MKIEVESIFLVIAVNQHINYAEHLPILLGEKAQHLVDHISEKEPKLPYQSGFTVPEQGDPSVRNEFTVAGYRWGHPQIPDLTDSADGNLKVTETIQTKENFFDPDFVYRVGPGNCLRGAMLQNTNDISVQFADAVQNNLFKPNNHHHGTDLLSINIAVS